MGSPKGGSQTIGYKYFMSLLMGFGRGAISELVEIKVGGKRAWKGPLCSEDTFYIDSPDLFGGDEKEGGVQGPARILFGAPTQVLPGPSVIAGKTLPGVKETISPNEPMPFLRGISALWFDGTICSLNPYPKEWKFRIRRHVHGWAYDDPWYPAKAVIYLSAPEVLTSKEAAKLGMSGEFADAGGTSKQSARVTVPGNIKSMGGAHIIYECVTNPEWGRGITADLLDENSFVYAANQLCNEGFGLCFFWSRQEDVDEFIQTVVDHIGGVLYTDRSTGLLTLRLIRNDYDPALLPLFTLNSGLLDILSDDSGSQDIAYNEVIVKYHDPITDLDGEARAQNVGARIAQGSSNSLTKNYPGLPTKDLAGRVAVRELIVQSSGLKKFKVRLDRSGWRIAPGMPFRISCPERGIANIVLRAGEITDSSIQQGGYIEIAALEDVFSMPLTSMVQPEQGSWVPPTTDPVPPDASAIFEMSYYDMVKHAGSADVAVADKDDGFMAVVAAQPLPTQPQYDLFVKDDGTPTWTNVGTFSFTGTAILSEAIDELATEITLIEQQDFPEDIIGDSLMIGDERVRIDAYNPTTGVMTIARGAVDTLPQPHEADIRVWLPDDDISSNRTAYSEGETVYGAAATRSNSGVLPEDEFESLELEVEARQGRPYPVGDLKVDGVSVFSLAGEYDTPEITWATRNRVLQEDQLVGHGDASVVEEAGTTYEVVIMDINGSVLSIHPLPAGSTSFTYTGALQGVDGSPDIIRIDVMPVRDGLRPLQHYNRQVVINGGWDYEWGNNWG